MRSGTSNFTVVTTRLPGAGLRPPPTPVTVTHKKRKKNVDAVTVCFLALCCIVELYTLIYQKWPPIRAVIGVDYRYNGNVSQLIRPTTATCMTALQLRCMCLHSASICHTILQCVGHAIQGVLLCSRCRPMLYAAESVRSW